MKREAGEVTVTLDDWLKLISATKLQILLLCEASLGSYIEIAYEWSWEEAQDMLEILELRAEMEERESRKAELESGSN